MWIFSCLIAMWEVYPWRISISTPQNPSGWRDFSSHSILPTISSSYLRHTTLSSAISIILSRSALHNRPCFPVRLFNNLFCPPPVLPFSAATPPPYVSTSVPPLPFGGFRPYHVKEPDGCLPRSAHCPIIFLRSPIYSSRQWEIPCQKKKKTLHTGYSLLSIRRMMSQKVHSAILMLITPIGQNILIGTWLSFLESLVKDVEKVRNREGFCPVQL